MQALVRFKPVNRIVLLAVVLLFAWSQIGASPANSGYEQTSSPAETSLPEQGNESKLSYRLDMLANTQNIQSANPDELAQSLSLPAEGFGSLSWSDSGQIMVDIRASDLSDSLQESLRQAGAEILDVAQNYRTVTAYVNPADLNNLAALPSVENVFEVLAPVVNGSANSSRQDSIDYTCPWGNAKSVGDSLLHADQARSNYSLSGSGVKIGVISDSYNKDTSAGTSASTDIASGDLPGSTNPCGYTSTISPVYDYPGSNVTDEGRAMLQIIHDLAPGAGLSFATGGTGENGFANNIRALRNAGADIIVDDLYYPDEPFYQDGPVSVAISDVVNSGALYFTATGNDNASAGGNYVSSYEAPAYRPITCPTLGGSTIGGTCHNFNTGTGTDPLSGVQLASGGTLSVTFQWAEPWYGVTDNFDIYLVDNNSSHNILASSKYINNGISGIQEPFEYFSYTNHTASSISVNIVVNRLSGSGKPRLKYIFIQSNLAVLSTEYNISSGGDIVGPAVFGHAASLRSLSVAAAPYTSTTVPEYYSSRGPATHYFGPVVGTSAAAALTTPLVLQQPDFTATDGVCTTFFYENYDGCERFFGTSAAAPHAAAIAALVEQKANQMGVPLTQPWIKAILQSSAHVMSGGDQYSTGAGLLDANAAVTELINSKWIYLPTVLR